MSAEPGGLPDREASTASAVAREEADRDDAGRHGDDGDDGGWSLQSRLFGAVAAFVAFIGVVYWFMSYESAGTTLLALTAGLALLTAAYVGWPRRSDHLTDDADDTDEPEPGHDPHDGVWFPEASIWPVAVAAAMVMVANGLLLGRWLLIPAGVFLVWSLAGMVRQGRHRI